MSNDLVSQRQQLIASLQRAGVNDPRVLAAVASVPRERFISEHLQNQAYADRALPLILGQTISQPLMVAIMTQALGLNGHERVLEIGTGSGYQTAILSRVAAYVYSVERHSQLTYQAALHLSELAIQNVSLYVGDGSLGWPDDAPYDRILVTASAPDVPSHLLAQLVVGGRLVIPVGSHDMQDLRVIERLAAGTRVESLGRCVFVPLIGEEGWCE